MSKLLKTAALLLSISFALDLNAQSAADEQAVYAVLEAAITAFDNHDADAFAALYAENADFIAPPGELLHGRQAILAAHAALFNMIPKADKSSHEYVDKKVRFLGADQALLTARMKFTDVIGEKTSTDEMSFSLLLRRNGGKWWVELTTLTPVAPPMSGN